MCSRHWHMIALAKGYCTPSLYGAGYAKSDITTCLPAPQRWWGALGRSEHAVFRGPDNPDSGESVYSAVLHRSQHRPGLAKQARTRPDGSTYSIVKEAPAFAEIGPICFGLWFAKNGVLNQFFDNTANRGKRIVCYSKQHNLTVTDGFQAGHVDRLTRMVGCWDMSISGLDGVGWFKNSVTLDLHYLTKK
jgi:hypothetical protein